jgi:hypothetical protein
MEITRTINADKRYYIDENLIINPGSLIDTEHRFNDMITCFTIKNIKVPAYL